MKHPGFSQGHSSGSGWWQIRRSATSLFTRIDQGKPFLHLSETGILVSDDYGIYRSWVEKRCLAHLIRQAKSFSEMKTPSIREFGQRHSQARKSGQIFTPNSSGYFFFSRKPMTRPERWPSACSERWMPYGSFLRRRGWNQRITLVKEPCTLAWSGESAVMAPKAIKGTGGWREYLRSNRPAAHDPCRYLLDAIKCYFKEQKPDMIWLA